MRKITGKQDMDGVFALMLLAVFACCIVTVLFMGGESYRRLTARDAESYDRRTGVQYVAAKIRSSDCSDCIFVGDFEEGISQTGSTLHLISSVDGIEYDTRIYCFDGYVRELFAEKNENFAPEDGNEILPAKNLNFSYDEGHRLLTIQETDQNGSEEELTLRLRSSTEAES